MERNRTLIEEIENIGSENIERESLGIGSESTQPLSIRALKNKNITLSTPIKKGHPKKTKVVKFKNQMEKSKVNPGGRIPTAICHSCSCVELPRALKPAGKSVTKDKWLGCDFCVRWFHAVCAKKNSIGKNISKKKWECGFCLNE